MPLIAIFTAGAGELGAAAAAAAAAQAATAAAAAPALAAATAPTLAAAAAPVAATAAPALTGMTAAELAGGAGATANLVSPAVTATQLANTVAPEAAGIIQGAASVPGAVGSTAATAPLTPAGITQAGAEIPGAVGATPAGVPTQPGITSAMPNGGYAGSIPQAPAPDIVSAADAYSFNPQLTQAPMSTGDAAAYNWGQIPGQTPAVDQGVMSMAQQASSTPADVMGAPGDFAAQQLATAPSGSALERGIKSAVNFMKEHPYATSIASAGLQYLMRPEEPKKKKYERRDMSGFQASTPQTGVYTPVYAPMQYAVGGPIEDMAAQNAVGANAMYPMAGINTPVYANPAMQRPEAVNVIAPTADAGVGAYTGEAKFAEGGDVDAQYRRMLGEHTSEEQQADADAADAIREKFGYGIVTDSDVDTRRKGPMEASLAQLQKIGKRTGVPVAKMPKSGIVDPDVFHAAKGGIMSTLGGYSDGGRLLKGPGDGMSDDIPATIGKKQPARLADGEFVVPADVVSHLGNGSTDAGAKKLYAMMDSVRSARTGSKKQGKQIKGEKYLPKA